MSESKGVRLDEPNLLCTIRIRYHGKISTIKLHDILRTRNVLAKEREKSIHGKKLVRLTFEFVVYCDHIGRDELPFPSLGVKLSANESQ